MKAFAILFAVLAFTYAHDEDNDYNTLCETGYPNPFGDGWFYLGDMASTEGYTTFYDNTTGRVYYWNICGYDDNEEFEQICGEDNAVCYAVIAQEGQASAQAFFPAGSYEQLSAEVIEDNTTVLLLLTYGGDSISTSFALICDENATIPVVDSISYSSDNSALLMVRTSAACVRDTLPSGCAQFWNRRKMFHIAFWSFVSLFAVCCCCAGCAIRRRRRCARDRAYRPRFEMECQNEKPSTVATPAPQPVQPATPQLVQMGGQYFVTMNGVQYPVQMVPAPQYAQYMQAMQQQQFAPVPIDATPSEELIDLQTVQLDEDEKFARQLQAQLNQ